MLSERLQRAFAHAGELPVSIQEDIAEQIEEMLAYPAISPQSISIHDLIGDDGGDVFFDRMMDDLDRPV